MHTGRHHLAYYYRALNVRHRYRFLAIQGNRLYDTIVIRLRRFYTSAVNGGVPDVRLFIMGRLREDDLAFLNSEVAIFGYLCRVIAIFTFCFLCVAGTNREI